MGLFSALKRAKSVTRFIGHLPSGWGQRSAFLSSVPVASIKSSSSGFFLMGSSQPLYGLCNLPTNYVPEPLASPKTDSDRFAHRECGASLDPSPGNRSFLAWKASGMESLEETEIAIIEAAEAHLPHASLYLFGSRARGVAGRRSDFDLAIVPGKDFTETERMAFNEAHEESTRIIYPIDLVDWHEASPSLQQRIREEGVLWKK
jgi:predicted nucleotidyltransferase